MVGEMNALIKSQSVLQLSCFSSRSSMMMCFNICKYCQFIVIIEEIVKFFEVLYRFFAKLQVNTLVKVASSKKNTAFYQNLPF